MRNFICFIHQDLCYVLDGSINVMSSTLYGRTVRMDISIGFDVRYILKMDSERISAPHNKWENVLPIGYSSVMVAMKAYQSMNQL